MKTNDLKKGMWVLLRNGWHGEVWDNAKGNTRVVDVYGFEHEAGSVYSHDIVAWAKEPATRFRGELGMVKETNVSSVDSFDWVFDIEYTPAQLKCKQMATALGM